MENKEFNESLNDQIFIDYGSLPLHSYANRQLVQPTDTDLSKFQLDQINIPSKFPNVVLSAGNE